MNRFGLADRFDYVCTAGGAMVQFLSRQADARHRGAQGRRPSASADGAEAAA